MDAPFRLADPHLQARLLATMDVEEKIPRALLALGEVAGRSVLLLDSAPEDLRARQLRAMGAQLTVAPLARAPELPQGSFEVIVAAWTGFDGAVDPAAPLRPTWGLLAPEGRLLCLQDYGRDDTSALWDDPDRERLLVGWTHRLGPLLRDDWRVRTLHCWWTFADLEEASGLLGAAFPVTGAAVASGLRRPRLSHKVAVFHRRLEAGTAT